MAQYGLRMLKSGGAASEDLPLVNSSAIAIGDPVYAVNNSGQNAVRLAAPAEPIYGIAQESMVGNGVRKVKVLKVRPDTTFVIENDNDTNTFGTSGYGLGNYFNIIGSTGEVLIDTSSGIADPAGAAEGTPNTFRQFVCVNDKIDSANAALGEFKVNPAMLQA